MMSGNRRQWGWEHGPGVAVGVLVAVGVRVTVADGEVVAVSVGMLVVVAVVVADAVGDRVDVPVAVGVEVEDAVGVSVGIGVPVGVGVTEAVGVGVVVAAFGTHQAHHVLAPPPVKLPPLPHSQDAPPVIVSGSVKSPCPDIIRLLVEAPYSM